MKKIWRLRKKKKTQQVATPSAFLSETKFVIERRKQEKEKEKKKKKRKITKYSENNV